MEWKKDNVQCQSYSVLCGLELDVSVKKQSSFSWESRVQTTDGFADNIYIFF